MTTQTEALKLALEALENHSGNYKLTKDECVKYRAVEDAIKEALAQPEQDKERCVGCEACIDTACGRDECPKGWPKAAQPEQEPTNLERHERNVQKFLGTQQPKEPEQEPACCNGNCPNTKDCEQAMQCLYTTPPQRTWVGLTDEDCFEALKAVDPEAKRLPLGFSMYAANIQAKFKEKNT